MKVITLRLPDIEAAALDRAAIMQNSSKNELIKNLLQEEIKKYLVDDEELTGIVLPAESVLAEWEYKSKHAIQTAEYTASELVELYKKPLLEEALIPLLEDELKGQIEESKRLMREYNYFADTSSADVAETKENMLIKLKDVIYTIENAKLKAK